MVDLTWTMLLISYGITKSGSTLAFELAKAILENAGFPQRQLPSPIVEPDHAINYIDQWNIGRLNAALAEIGTGEYIAVKTHGAPDAEMLEMLRQDRRNSRVKVHIISRDPRDIILSLMDAGENNRRIGEPAFSDVFDRADAIRYVCAQAINFNLWAKVRGARHFYYDDLAFDMRRTIERMARHLGVACAGGKVELQVRTDAFTQFNKGLRDRWRTETPTDEAAETASRFADLIATSQRLRRRRRLHEFWDTWKHQYRPPQKKSGIDSIQRN